MNQNRIQRETYENDRIERTAAAYQGTVAKVISFASVHAPSMGSAPAPRQA
ncbi:MAG: hypothetical protein HYU57_08085 [Micavibrio aeruginosavorus]|nr:hypothetical protein [Micavibrio aeruginosavorus]